MARVHGIKQGKVGHGAEETLMRERGSTFLLILEFVVGLGYSNPNRGAAGPN